MKTINIKGKEYVTVNERLKEFRNNFKDYALVTEIVELGVDYATVKASIIDDKGILRATGFAREVVAKSPINKFAFLENCETSAIGRALGNFGIGIDNAVCTADELLMKLSQETKEPKSPESKDFEKQAAAEKTARTKALKAGREIPAQKQSLDERYQNTVKYLEENKDREFTNGVIDRINGVINDLFSADEFEKATTLNELMNKHAGIEDGLDAVLNGTADFEPYAI